MWEQGLWQQLVAKKDKYMSIMWILGLPWPHLRGIYVIFLDTLQDFTLVKEQPSLPKQHNDGGTCALMEYNGLSMHSVIHSPVEPSNNGTADSYGN